MNDGGEEEIFLYMAPLKGITDALFRRVYCHHFSGLDGAVAPFINPQSKAICSDKLLSDLLPANNCSLPLIPQLLNTDPAGFLALSDRLFELGYQEINWNLGCPVRMVAKKKRGSGLLPYPELIVENLESILNRLKPALSIKMRLGYHDYSESARLLPLLERFPLSEVIIHPRLGVQLYKGRTAPEHFEQCSRLTSHQLVYNGDIVTLDDYLFLSARFPQVKRWMIGRGLLANPFLPSEIKGMRVTDRNRSAMLEAFHAELFAAMKEKMSGPGHLLGRMKQVWIYFIEAFPGRKKLLKKITRSSTEKHYLEAVQEIIKTTQP